MHNGIIVTVYYFSMYRSISNHDYAEWPTIPLNKDTESVYMSAYILLGLDDSPECHSVPRNIQRTATFLVNTSELGSTADTKCDDNGAWTNNGVRKLWLSIHLPNDNESTTDSEGDIPNIHVKQRGVKRPDAFVWCLIRSYYKHKHSDDFRKVITSLQG